MTVPAASLNRITTTMVINGIRMQSSFYTSNPTSLPDVDWRNNCLMASQRVWGRLSGYMSNEVFFEGMTAKLLTLPYYPVYAASFNPVPQGVQNFPALHPGAYMWVQCIGFRTGSVKPFRSGFRLPGIAKAHCNKNTWSQEITQVMETLVQKEMSLEISETDPLPLLARPLYAVPHQNVDKTWDFMNLAKAWCSGPVKTVGSRFYP